jgi:Rod binding domain-containing protein
MKLHGLQPNPMLQQSAPDPQQKINSSCRQFEAGIWRSMLEDAMAMPKSAGSDVYQYMMTDKVADKLAGQKGGFAEALAAQINRKPGKGAPDPTSTTSSTTADQSHADQSKL